MKILITGANGFIGLRVLQRLNSMSDLQVLGSVRRAISNTNTRVVEVGDLTAKTNWFPTLDGIDAVVHLAGRAHLKKDNEADPLRAFRTVNVEATLNLARQAAAAGVSDLFS